MQSLKKIEEKFKKDEKLSSEEVAMLLKSRQWLHKSVGIDTVQKFRMTQHKKLVAILAYDCDDVIASDALDCLNELDSQLAVRLARKLYKSKRQFVLSSSIFILGEHKDRAWLSRIKKLEPKYRRHLWQQLLFWEYYYKLDPKEEYLEAIISILNRTYDYHTQCSAINILRWLVDKKNKHLIKPAIAEFAKRDLPRSVTSTIDNFYKDCEYLKL